MQTTSQRKAIERRLEKIRQDGQWRSLRVLGTAGPWIEWEGRTLLNFASNDYLGLSREPEIRAAAHEAIDRWGCGATSSRLLAGSFAVHEELEDALAALVQQPRALVFPSGYQTNIAVLSALGGDGTIFSDERNHASIIDGARLARAAVEVYPHNDVDYLSRRLRETPDETPKLIVTESVFSMDGDQAPLLALRSLADRYGALLVVDEAHALGVFGRGGGLCVAQTVVPDVTIGTLGKALGSGGGFIAADDEILDLIINQARGFIFSTGLSPVNAAAALASVRWLTRHPEIGEQLLARAALFSRQLSDLSGAAGERQESQIVSWIIGENDAALEVAEALLGVGIFAPAIRPPTVPAGSARLRLSITAGHDTAMLTDAITRIAGVYRETR